jgi:hypothetical protein
MQGDYRTQRPPLQQIDMLNLYRTLRYIDDPIYFRNYKSMTTVKSDTRKMNNQFRTFYFIQ